MSFSAQFNRYRQSGHATYILPPASIAEATSPALRRLPASRWLLSTATLTAAFQVLPPLVEMNAMMSPLSPLIGTTTVPFGRTSGTPPTPESLATVVCSGLQVKPPSVEVLIST